jgi:precorrin-4 methylase
MQMADVVLYDRLVSDDILQLVHGGAVMVYVGKEAGYHTRTQEEIHQLLLTFAEAGAVVVRLKGGDPYVFGRYAARERSSTRETVGADSWKSGSFTSCPYVPSDMCMLYFHSMLEVCMIAYHSRTR